MFTCFSQGVIAGNSQPRPAENSLMLLADSAGNMNTKDHPKIVALNVIDPLVPCPLSLRSLSLSKRSLFLALVHRVHTRAYTFNNGDNRHDEKAAPMLAPIDKRLFCCNTNT